MAAAVALVVSACSGSPANNGDAGQDGNGTYTIGIVYSKTGGFAAAGFEVYQGAKAAEKVFGAEAVNGKKLKFVYVDDATATDVSFQVCTRLATQDHVDAIVSEQLSPNTAACLQAVSSSGIPFINADQNPGNLCAPNLYTTGSVNSQLILPLVEYMLDKGQKKFYLIGSDSAAPRTGLPLAKELIEKSGGSVVGLDYVPTGNSDYSGFISRIAAANPDTVLDAISDTTALQYYKLLMTDPRTQSMVRGGFTATSNQIESLGAAAEGYLLQSVYFPLLETPAAEAYNKLSKELFGSDVTYGAHGVRTYDGIAVLVEALKNAKSTSTDDVLASLATTKADVPQGTMEFTKDSGRFAIQPNLIGEFQADGTVKVVQNKEAVDPTGTCAP